MADDLIVGVDQDQRLGFRGDDVRFGLDFAQNLYSRPDHRIRRRRSLPKTRLSCATCLGATTRAVLQQPPDTGLT
jgi:hypothetical protein